MAYRHKLSCRLALLRDVLVLVVLVAASAARARPSAPPTGPASCILPVMVVPSVTLNSAQQFSFVVYGTFATRLPRAASVSDRDTSGPLLLRPEDQEPKGGCA